MHNLKPVNLSINVTYFSLPMLREILPCLKKGYYACKLDLKLAYFHMPIAKRDAPWLAFRQRGRVCRWDCLPFVLNIDPREWQGMMLPVVSHLRRKGVLLWVDLDDFLIIPPRIEHCALHAQWLADLLCRLGVWIHNAKSILTPTRVLVFLSFLLDLQDATVPIPPHKVKCLLHDVRRLMEAETPTCRRCSSVLGRVRAFLFAAPQMRLYTDALAQHVAVLSRRGLETQASLPEQVTIQLELVMEEVHQWRGRQFTVNLEKTHMWTDASDNGWGATMQNQMATFGWFSTTQGHIDLRELRAGVNAIKSYLLRDTELHLEVDNMVFFHYLKKWGGRIRRLNNLMQDLWEYCRQMNMFIIPHYVPSKLNPGDVWSHQQITLTEASLDPRSMEIIRKKFSCMSSGTEWMASAVNRQCPQFISEYPQPGAFGVDIFTQQTHKVSPGFCNPPWHLNPKMLAFLEEATHYEVLLVVPYHPLKPWWHKFQSMTQMTITIFQATYQLQDRVAVKARQPMICGWLCKTTSDSKEPPRKKCRCT